MQQPTIGWQSWSPPYAAWHGYPLWDYSPFNTTTENKVFRSRRQLKKRIAYWCSWYAHGIRISDAVITKNLNVIKNKSIPINTILIDDGWTEWGDWSRPDPQKFSNFTRTIQLLHQQDFLVGLWLAPFLASRSSQIYKHRPEWFVSNNNKHVQGYKTIPLFEIITPYRPILNTSIPEVRGYLSDCIDQMVGSWKVDILKLDFLYAPYFDPNHLDDKFANSQIAWLLSYINKKYPDLITIGCGAPFDPTAELIDVMRIYKDTAFPPTSPRWLNKIVYNRRVNNLAIAMQAANWHKLNTDPDVRMFGLDSPRTTLVWDTIHSSIVGIGDDLTRLSDQRIKIMNIWLTKYFSQ